MRVGFIGLGSQGGPMAHAIAAAGHPLTLWARRPEVLDEFDVDTAATPAELGAASDLVGICVFGEADVDEVLLGDDGVLAGMTAGGIVAIHSTIHPDACRRLAAAAAERGIALVDAPVSGGGQAAAAGNLLVMVGGDDADVDRCRPVLESFADPIVHLGPVGSGQVAKVINNLVLTAQLIVALETYELGDALGVEREALAEVLAHGSGGSRAAAILAASGFDTSGIAGAASLLRKDVDIAADLAPVPPGLLLQLAQATFDRLS